MSIKTDAVVIRDETTTGANTATRIGTNLVDIADDLVAKQSAIDLNTVNKQDNILANYKVLPSDFDFTAIPVGYDNATWIIRYDFDLAAAVVTLPANVTLSFEGGSIANGSIALNNTTIAYYNVESVLTNVVLTGTITNDILDSRLFGMLPNNPAIDCTVIYDTYLAALDLGLYFSKGDYYMTEWHVTKDNFRVEADRHTDIECLVSFNPFNNTQFYIMKLGGGKFTLNDDSAHIKNAVISHIQFTTPIGYAPQALTDFAGTSTAGIVYKNSALVIDKCQVGRFAINGNTIHNTPLLSIGASYELHFDYLTMYGNHGKSDLPIYQLLPDFSAPTQGYISASVIEKIMVEVFVGPIWKESDNCGINEILINDVIIEGTIEWEAESIVAENRFTRLTKTLPDYYTSGVNLVPMFEFNAVSNIIIDNLIINATDTEWQNSLDANPTGFNTRSLFKFGLQEGEIQINNIINGGFSQNFYLEGTASEVYRNKLNINRANEDTYFFNAVTGGLDVTTNTYNNKIIKLKEGYEYINDDLSKLLNAEFITNTGLSNNLGTIDEDKYTKVINTYPNYPILSKEGFYVDEDIITIVGKIATTQSAIDVEYYDVSDNLLSTQVTTFGITPNVIFTNSITLTKPANYSYLKLVQKGAFLAKTYSIRTSNAVEAVGTSVDLSATVVTYAATVNDAYTPLKPNRVIILAGDCTYTVTGSPTDGASGILEIKGTGTITLVNTDASELDITVTAETKEVFFRVNSENNLFWSSDATATGDFVAVFPDSPIKAIEWIGTQAQYDAKFGLNYTPAANERLTITDAPDVQLTGDDIQIDAAGFDGNLAVTDDTVQKVTQKLDDLVNVSITSFPMATAYRAWQGVGVDENYIYVCSDRDENFVLSNTISVYKKDGTFVKEATNVYTQTGTGGKFMSFGSTIYIDATYLYIPTYDFNDGFVVGISRVARFNKDTLAYVDEFDIGAGVAESITFYNGEWFVCYNDVMEVRKFNTSWVQQAIYPLSQTIKAAGGYQAILFIDDDFYFNWHGDNTYGGDYASGVDKYSFNGSAFTYLGNTKAPTYGSGQGVATFDGNNYYWVDRPANRIISTNSLTEYYVPQESDGVFPIVNGTDEVIVGSDTTQFGYKMSIGSLAELDIEKSSNENVVVRFKSPLNGDTQIIHLSDTNKYLTGYDAAPISGYRLYHYGFSKPVLFSPFANDRIGLNGITDPKSKLEIGGGIKIANDADAASADKVGTLRYRTSGNNSYVDMCMQTGASTYAWVNIQTNAW